MNIVITGIIIFVLVFLLLSWFARQKTKKIAKGVRSSIVILSLLIAIILAIGGRVLFSLPLFFYFKDPDNIISNQNIKIKQSIIQIKQTFNDLKKYKNVIWFLISRLFFFS